MCLHLHLHIFSAYLAVRNKVATKVFSPSVLSEFKCTSAVDAGKRNIFSSLEMYPSLESINVFNAACIGILAYSVLRELNMYVMRCVSCLVDSLFMLWLDSMAVNKRRLVIFHLRALFRRRHYRLQGMRSEEFMHWMYWCVSVLGIVFNIDVEFGYKS